jgi:hypothetical protein
LFDAIEDEKPQTKHVVSLSCYFVHFGGIVSARNVGDFKSKFAPKKWKEKFKRLVGVGTSFEHNHECYVKGSECQVDPNAIFRFVSAIRATPKAIKAMVLKHEARAEYNKLPPNEKYDGHAGGAFNTATHLLQSHSAIVGPVKGKSTVIAAECVVVRTVLELCGAGLIDLGSDLGIDHSLGVERKFLCFFLCFCASDYIWSHAKRRISSMRIDTAIEVEWKSSSSGGSVDAHTHAPRTSGRRAAAPPLSSLQSKSVLRVSLPLPQPFESLSFPGAFESLEDVSKLALVEYLFLNQNDLKLHGDDGAVVKIEIDDEWDGSPLPYPLPTRDNPKSVVTMADVMSLLRFVTRRFVENNVTKDNTGAWGNRGRLKATIERARTSHLERLTQDQPPPVALALRSCFDPNKPLLDCYGRRGPAADPSPDAGAGTPKPTSAGCAAPTWEDALKGEENFRRWLRPRKEKWQQRVQKATIKRRQKKELRRSQRASSDIPILADVVPWKELHPTTGQLYLPHKKAAQLRYIRTEALISQRNMPALLSMFYAFFTGEAIPERMTISSETMSICDQALAEHDSQLQREKLSVLFEEEPAALVHLLTDDTEHKGDRHQVQVSYWDSVLGCPCFELLGMANTTMKLSEANAAENEGHLRRLGIPDWRYGGGAGDRPGLVEYNYSGSFKAKVPGEWHTHALHHKHFSHGAFGVHKGLDDRSHYCQLLHTLYSIQRFKVGVEIWKSHIRRYICKSVPWSGGFEPFYLTFHDPNTGRWKYTCVACAVVLKLQRLELLGKPFLESFLRYLDDITPSGKAALRDMIQYAITAIDDPRITVAMTAEVEFKEVIYDRATNWLLFDTAAGWPRAWAILELTDRLRWVDKPLHDRLLGNWGQCLPKTAAQILRLGGDDLATQLKGQMMAGVKAMIDEHTKNYRWIYTPQYAVLWMFCRGESGSASRAIFQKLQGIGHFPNATFEQPDLTNAGDKFYVDLLGPASSADELKNIFQLWSLLDAKLTSCFIKLCENPATTKEGDTLVAGFTAGRDLIPLFDVIKVGAATLPTSTAIVEQRFSELKQRDMANSSQKKVDQDMCFSSNTLTAHKRQRRGAFGNKGSAKCTGAEVVMAGTQMLENSEEYSAENMKGITSRRKLKGKLTVSTRNNADRSVETITDARDKQNRRAPISDEDWEAKKLEFRSAPTTHQQSLKAVSDTNDADRILAVLREETFAGQNGRSAVFYKKLKAAEVPAVVALHFPLIQGSFMQILERKKETAEESDRRGYLEGAAVVRSMPFEYKKEVTEVKRNRRHTRTVQVRGKLMGVRIDGDLVQRARKLKTNGGLLATEKQEAFAKLRSFLGVVSGFLGERDRALVDDFGFFIRARRGNVIDQSLRLDDGGVTSGDGPAIKEARKRKWGGVG